MSLRCRKPLPQNNLIYTSNQLITDCPRYWWTHYGHGHVRAIMPCDIETKRLPLELCRPFQFCRHFTLPPVTPPPSPPATQRGTEARNPSGTQGIRQSLSFAQG